MLRLALTLIVVSAVSSFSEHTVVVVDSSTTEVLTQTYYLDDAVLQYMPDLPSRINADELAPSLFQQILIQYITHRSDTRWRYAATDSLVDQGDFVEAIPVRQELIEYTEHLATHLDFDRKTMTITVVASVLDTVTVNGKLTWREIIPPLAQDRRSAAEIRAAGSVTTEHPKPIRRLRR